MREATGGGSTGAAPRRGPAASTTPHRVAARRVAWGATIDRVATASFTVLVSAAVAATFAPWLRSGSATRTSHEVVLAADRLDVLDAAPQAVWAVAWAFLPLLAVLAVSALALGRRRLAGALAVVVGLLEVVLALAIKGAPRSADWGTSAGLAIGSALVVAALAIAATSRSAP